MIQAEKSCAEKVIPIKSCADMQNKNLQGENVIQAVQKFL